MEREELRNIEEFPDYFVGNFGNVYSTRVSRRHNPNGSFYKINPWMNHPSGYINVGMYNTKGIENKTYRRLHRVVWEAFNGPIPKGMQVDHKDGNKKNNRLDNLQLLTAKQNVLKYHRVDKVKK